jgi:ureidoacrylate peracid hydrolase
MHKIALSDAALKRMSARTGKQHPFDEIDPRKAALIVIDMQN